MTAGDALTLAYALLVTSIVPGIVMHTFEHKRQKRQGDWKDEPDRA